MKEFFEKIFTSKPAKVFYMFVLVFGWVAALATGIAMPIVAGYWFWAIPITAAVAVAAPSYFKAAKWCIEGLNG